jgi:hypothetical protein
MSDVLRRLIFVLLGTLGLLTSSGQSQPSDRTGELRTTKLTQTDIDWLRSATVGWDNCEAGAPIIEPAGQSFFSGRASKRLADLLPIFFLHARFAPGVYDIGSDQPFTVTPDHIKLLKVASWRGAAIDCKRPYGDFTNFTIDMAEALGLPITIGANRIARISPQDDERLGALHLQMQKVVAAYMRHAALSPGSYLAPRDGLEPEGAARPRLVPPTQDDFQKFLKEIAEARKSGKSWPTFSAIAGLYSAP